MSRSVAGVIAEKLVFDRHIVDEGMFAAPVQVPQPGAANVLVSVVMS